MGVRFRLSGLGGIFNDRRGEIPEVFLGFTSYAEKSLIISIFISLMCLLLKTSLTEYKGKTWENFFLKSNRNFR